MLSPVAQHPSPDSLSDPTYIAKLREQSRSVPELERARKWTVAAQLPASGATGTEISVPPMWLAVQDRRTIGNPGLAVYAEVYSFAEEPGLNPCSGTGAGHSIVPSSASNVTDDFGVTSLDLRIETAGCGPGELALKITAPYVDEAGEAKNVTRYAVVRFTRQLPTRKLLRSNSSLLYPHLTSHHRLSSLSPSPLCRLRSICTKAAPARSPPPSRPPP